MQSQLSACSRHCRSLGDRCLYGDPEPNSIKACEPKVADIAEAKAVKEIVSVGL